MKSEEIKTLFAQFESASAEIEGVECWSARELQKLLGYTQWRNFENTIDKAKESCINAGGNLQYHFADVSKVIEAGKYAVHEIDNILLTRYAMLKRKLGVPDKRPVADFLPTINIKAKDLAAEMTSVNVQAKDLKGVKPIETEHVDNNLAVRNMLLKRGIVPESLPPAEDIKKVECKLKNAEKKALKSKTGME